MMNMRDGSVQGRFQFAPEHAGRWFARRCLPRGCELAPAQKTPPPDRGGGVFY